MLSRLTVVIPAAGKGSRAADLLASRRYGIPKSLLEAGRFPVIVEVFEQMRRWLGPSHTLDVRVVIGKNGGKIPLFLRRYYGHESFWKHVHFYRQPKPTGPLAAIIAAKPLKGPLILWTPDTLIGEIDPPLIPDSIYTKKISSGFKHWTIAVTNGQNNIRRFIYKPSLLRLGAREQVHAFTGIAYIHDGAAFQRAAKKVVEDKQKECGEYQFHNAFAFYGQKRPLKTAPLPQWLDAGNPETFLKTKETYLERVDSHQLVINADKGLIHKKALNARAQKAQAQTAHWYGGMRAANPQIRKNIPWPVTVTGKTMSMPYIDWPLLTDWYLYRSLYIPKESAAIFSSFLKFVSQRLHRRVSSSTLERRKSSYWMLLEKPLNRLAEAADLHLPTDFMRLNGTALGNWESLKTKFIHLAEHYADTPELDWRLLHGDLTFSNILAAKPHRFCLIDPRASYGGAARLGGDRYYDYAKIAQCVFSYFDSIKKNEFILSGSGKKGYRLEFPRSEIPGRKHWKNIFIQFCRKEKLDMNRLRFMEATSLLSLLPFHRQHPRQALAAYLCALKILKDLR